MITLLMILALGLLGLSSVELRKAGRSADMAVAQANARTALMQALGQLQKAAGPDQRVTATAELHSGGGASGSFAQKSSSVDQPHWAGVWRTTRQDGSPIFSRDDLQGGLKDTRPGATTTSGSEPFIWLVSGEESPYSPDLTDGVTMISDQGTGAAAQPGVRVPRVTVEGDSSKPSGHLAWWTGDLGVRANIATRDLREDVKASPANPTDGGLYRVMTSQAADMEIMSGGAQLADGERQRLASNPTAGLSKAGPAWSREHAFDFTVDSRGVLSDVTAGGLKRDLTVYLSGSGNIPDDDGLGGLSDNDSLVGVPADLQTSPPSQRHTKAGPRFGLLRDWARAAVPFNAAHVPANLPDLDTSSAAASRTRALCNENAVKLNGNKRSSLQPILVEASNFIQMSSYQVASSPSRRYQIRQLMYPRVVLWNPYNVPMSSDAMIVMIQGNGRQEMWTGTDIAGNQQWLCFEGGRSTSFNPSGDIMNSDPYKDPYMGSYYFSVPATEFEPGECLVFSPEKGAEYDGLSAYRLTNYNLANNILSCKVAPDPGRSYYVSGSDIATEGQVFRCTSFWYSPTPAWGGGVKNQGDDTRVIMKSLAGASTVKFEDFDKLPQVTVLSASLQYGAGREPRIAWDINNPMTMELLSKTAPKPTLIPDRRTREGIRLRWFQEHPSNIKGSGPLKNTPYFDEALLANWNPRAAYIVRSPWENLGGTLPTGGQNSASGPWFFGAYTRDLFDQAVSWQEQRPVPDGGKFHGNPFGPPQEGTDRYVLFDVPRSETGIVSLAQLQHAKISDLVWHPSNAVGNSLADPRLGKASGNVGLNRTAAMGVSSSSANVGGFYQNDLGWSTDAERSTGKDAWASNARAILGDLPQNDNLVYDLSFEVNRTLWDRYFLSTGSVAEKGRFLTDPEKNPLPNGRMRLAGPARDNTADNLTDFHRAALELMVDGSFNVHSTRVEAWKALLASTRLAGYPGSPGLVPFPRVLNAPGGEFKTGGDTGGDAAWAGTRVLNEAEIDSLARAIVEQVKLRGPFVSLADFVNRRLAEDETGRMGPLQAAIEKSGINLDFKNDYRLDNSNSLPNYSHPDNIGDPTALEQTDKPDSKAWGAPGYLTQADVLQVIGPVLSARSDSFVIRAYGDALDADGKVTARAWCEAVVQRVPEPLKEDDKADAKLINPRNPNQPGDFGRRFVINSFRWLSPEEI